MSDPSAPLATESPEQVTNPEAQGAPATAGASPVSGEATQQPAPEATTPKGPDLSALDDIDPDTLRKHPRVAAVVGELFGRAKTSWEQERKAEADAEATRKAEEALLKLAEEDPYEFSQRYRSDKEKARIQAEVDGLKTSTRSDLLNALGRQTTAKYGFGPEELSKLAEALKGVSDDDTLAVFNATVVDIEADRRANRTFSDRWDKEIAKEREAIRKEVADEFRRGDAVPDLRPGSPVPPATLANLPPGPAFDRAYEALYPTAKRTVPASP